MRVKTVEGERMKLFRVAFKSDYQPARGNFAPAMLVGVRRFISFPKDEDKEFLKSVGYSDEEVAELEKGVGVLHKTWRSLSDKAKGFIAKAMNLKVEERKLEVFEYMKIREYPFFYRLAEFIGHNTAYLYKATNKDPEITEKVVLKALKKFIERGFYRGLKHYEHDQTVQV